MSFEELGLGPEVLKAIAERGYTKPTPIQEKAIPTILMTRDIVGLAQTGTGKTAAFTLPMIEILFGGRAKARMPRSLILEPTRELAAQVAENFDVYGKYHKLTKALLVGGESMGDQIKLLDRGVDVLIATPGRLLDLFDRGNILLSDIKILVIDEADRMLDMGFIPDIEKIVSKVPPMRQTLLFSATMPPEIKKLAEKFLSNPKEITVAAVSAPAESVKQSLVWAGRNDKKQVLDSIIRQEEVKNAFVFCNRKRDIGDLTRWLERKGYKAAPMHGDMPQVNRNETLKRFKDGEIVLLVCSDVAARGLDIAGVSHVFNFDVPFNAEDYVHRIGRTGRAGMTGRAWTIASSGDEKFVDSIERLIKKKIDVADIGSGKRDDGEGAGNRSAGRGDRHDRGGDRGRDHNHRRDRDRDNNRNGNHNHNNNRPPRHYEQEDDIGSNAPGFGNEMPDFFKRK
ncbi:MAG: DEAD/DEAH box helicase [Proteobacteria bacterium]|nr:DEAD/DEAH box helicase [Pseudomonadota bacterium]